MALVRYSGKFGKFEYDDKVWESGLDENGDEFFHYSGSETDGRRIRVPLGLTNAMGLFAGTDITIMPELPETVRVIDYCFAGCKDLRIVDAQLPSRLKSADSAWTYCVSIVNPPVLPDTLESCNYGFDGCALLESMANFPSKLMHAEYMYANCPNLKNRKPIPDSVLNKDNICFNSDSIDMNDDFEYDDFEDIADDYALYGDDGHMRDFVMASRQVYAEMNSDMRKEFVEDQVSRFSRISTVDTDEPDIAENDKDDTVDTIDFT